MSKTHELRKKALEAVRDRDWDRAVKLYERICTADSGNGSPRNELGDIFLKTGDVDNAIAQFQEAARLYQEYGLTNNAVAVHKKILRHEPNHLHSLWVLGEIRLGQGLDAEASASFMDFLARAEGVSPGDRDAFVSRSLQLLEKLGDDPEILSRLDAIFAAYDRDQERAQVLIAKARLAHDADEFEVRDKYVEHARAAFSHLEALPDYVQFRGHVEGHVEDRSDPSESELEAQSSEDSSGPGEVFALDENESLDDLDIDLGFDFDEQELSGAVERVSGRSTVSSGGEFQEPEPVTQEISVEAPDEHAHRAVDAAANEPAETSAPATEPDAVTSKQTVDLLSEILADESFDVKQADQRQLETIEQEMRGQIGAQVDASDHSGQYDLGIVYMDMGLFEQAAAAFAMASESDSDRLRALEMQGTCLLKLGRNTEAMSTFQIGLAVPGYPGRSYLGLLYGVGRCYEVEGNSSEAIDYLERVAAVDDSFLDVVERLQRLRSSGVV